MYACSVYVPVHASTYKCVCIYRYIHVNVFISFEHRTGISQTDSVLLGRTIPLLSLAQALQEHTQPKDGAASMPVMGPCLRHNQKSGAQLLGFM